MKKISDYASTTLARKLMKKELSSPERKTALNILKSRGDLNKLNCDKMRAFKKGDPVKFKPAKNSKRFKGKKLLHGIVIKSHCDLEKGVEWVRINVLGKNGIIGSCYKQGRSVLIENVI